MDRFLNGEIGEFKDIFDTDGNIINASDGGIIFAEGKYHWYGQALRPLPFTGKGQGGQVTDVGVVMYSSDDLYTWEYEGVILSVGEGELKAPMRFERPKIIYNEKTCQYVLWCHYVEYPGDHGFEVGKGEAGVAVCDKVNGKYKWLGYTRPIDSDGVVRDLTLYKDNDGKGYMIFDRDISLIKKADRCQYIIELSDDYLSFTDKYKRIEPCYRREASAIVRHGEYYFMITSDMTSWDFNRARYYRARSLFGEWEDMGDPCIGDTDGTTFASQTTYIFKPEDSDVAIHLSERHNTKNFERCSYVFLPIDFTSDGRLSLSYKEEWRLEK